MYTHLNAPSFLPPFFHSFFPTPTPAATLHNPITQLTLSQHLLIHPPHLIPITPIIIALHLLNHRLHLRALPFPLRFTHLALAAEELGVGLAVRAEEAVRQRRELAVVVVEVEVVHGVAGGAVDDGGVSYVFAVVCRVGS